jgi:Na+-transporting methylmalonyl-CoA/oxaloacetate decarboxylase gamma subunit
MDIVIPEGMTDAALLAVIIGFLAPLVLNFIVSATWPAWAKSLAAFAFAAVAGVLTAWITGAFEGLSIVSTVLLILVVSITAYQNFWKQVAPNMQRDAAKAEAIKEEKKEAEVAAVAVPVAAKVAQQVVNDQGDAPEPMTGPSAVG